MGGLEDNSISKRKNSGAFQDRKTGFIYRLFGRQFYRYLPLIVIAAAIIILGSFVPYFLTTRNILNIFKQSSALGLMAIGMTSVLIGGGIDLSIPSNMALGGILGAMFMRVGGNSILAGIIMVAMCIFVGILNGYAVAYLKMIPFVVTLSTMYITTGASVLLTKEVSVAGLHEKYINVLMGKVWVIPVPVIILIVITAIVVVIMRRSIYGRWLYAVGSSPEVSRALGIPTDRMIFATYVFSGLFAGMAAIITTARLASASATMGKAGIVLNVIGSAVVGGVSIYGGVGSALGAVVGAVFIVMITNSMNMMHVSYFMTLIVKGCVIIFVVALDSLRKGEQGQYIV